MPGRGQVRISVTRTDAAEVARWLSVSSRLEGIRPSSNAGAILFDLVTLPASPRDPTLLSSALQKFARRKRYCDIDPTARGRVKITILLDRQLAEWMSAHVEPSRHRLRRNAYLPLAVRRFSEECHRATARKRGRTRLTGADLEEALARFSDERHKKRLKARRRTEEKRAALGAVLANLLEI